MKKILFFAFFAVMSLTVSAQNKNDGTYEYFIEVYLEWGGKNHIPNVYFENDDSKYIYDTNGEKLKFKSRSAVINYFTKLGWIFVQDIITGSTNNSERLLLKKQIENIQDAKKGLIFEDELKKK
jgi:hypothetical protein